MHEEHAITYLDQRYMYFTFAVARREVGEMMKNLSSILQQGRKAHRDLELLSVLRSEISHELSSSPVEGNEAGGQLGDFVVEYDGEGSQDVLLKRKFESGEEVAVSAVLGLVDYTSPEGSFPRRVEMKVCVRKPGLSSVLLFNCKVPCHKGASPPYYIWNAHFVRSSFAFDPSVYKEPKFSLLPGKLQEQLRLYLLGKGIGSDLIEFLLSHLHRKEQQQYVRWLQTLETLVSNGQ